MIETGRKEDIERIDSGLRAKGLRVRVQITVGGNRGIDDLNDRFSVTPCSCSTRIFPKIYNGRNLVAVYAF
jgi:hypothetical protein